MTQLLFVTTILIGMFVKEEPKIEAVRGLFYKAAIDKSASDKFSKILSAVDNTSSPLLMCYKGVAEMMQAKHVFSPVTKLIKFKKGKTLIEQSISRSPADLELRFLRFSIQSNLPGFLGYDQEISKDKAKLLAGYAEVKDPELKKTILNYLSASKYCTADEIRRLTK